MRYVDRGELRRQYATDDRLRIRAETHRRYAERREELAEWVLAQLGVEPGEVVADVGCGPGTLYQPRLRELGARVLGVDASAGMLRVAAATCVPVRADAAALPIATASCDRVMCNHALYHVADQVAALREMRRVVRPGGRVVITTNSRRSMPQLRDVTGLTETLPFALEDRERVAAIFPSVRVREYRNRLLFPDPEPVVRYVATTHSDPALLAAVRDRVAGVIAERGWFVVDTLAGCFVADATH